MTSNSATQLPATVRGAAGFMLLYGIAALLNAVTMQAQAGWGEPWALGRALLRLLISGFIAWGLLGRMGWAWWIGLLWSVFGLAVGALAMLVFEAGDVYWLPPSRGQLLLGVTLLSLGGAIALLLSSSARAAFRPVSVSPDG
jgi:hypothetical protein